LLGKGPEHVKQFILHNLQLKVVVSLYNPFGQSLTQIPFIYPILFLKNNLLVVLQLRQSLFVGPIQVKQFDRQGLQV